MGWQAQTGNMDDPVLTGRDSFKQVISEATLRERLRAINPGPDGQPWLDDARLSEAVSALTRHGQRGLMEANQAVTELLLKGLTVEGLPRLGRRARPDHPLHRLGRSGCQQLHRREPVPHRLPAGP